MCSTMTDHIYPAFCGCVSALHASHLSCPSGHRWPVAHSRSQTSQSQFSQLRSLSWAAPCRRSQHDTGACAGSSLQVAVAAAHAVMDGHHVHASHAMRHSSWHTVALPFSAVLCAGHWLQIQARLSSAQHEGADQLSVLPPRGHLAHGSSSAAVFFRSLKCLAAAAACGAENFSLLRYLCTGFLARYGAWADIIPPRQAVTCYASGIMPGAWAANSNDRPHADVDHRIAACDMRLQRVGRARLLGVHAQHHSRKHGKFSA